MSNVEALKALYAALGGETSTVAGASTVVDVLNEISKLFSGDDDATLNAEAINNIAAVASALVPKPSQDKTVTPTTSEQTITADSGKVLGTVTVSSVTGTLTFKTLKLVEFEAGFNLSSPANLASTV